MDSPRKSSIQSTSMPHDVTAVTMPPVQRLTLLLPWSLSTPHAWIASSCLLSRASHPLQRLLNEWALLALLPMSAAAGRFFDLAGADRFGAVAKAPPALPLPDRREMPAALPLRPLPAWAAFRAGAREAESRRTFFAPPWALAPLLAATELGGPQAGVCFLSQRASCRLPLIHAGRDFLLP